MFRKILSTIAIGMILAGCQITSEQAKVIAQNAGLGSAVTWIAYDNPTPEVKTMVKFTLDFVVEKSVDVQAGKTYMEVIYPELEKFVQSGGLIEAQYKPIVLAGSLAALSGIDMLFAMHPEWKEQQSQAIDIVNSFVFGAKQGLSLSDKDPVIVQAQAASARRAKIFKE